MNGSLPGPPVPRGENADCMCGCGINRCRPSGPAHVYRLYDDSGALLYVGFTQQPVQRRLSGHRSKPWWPEVRAVEVDTFRPPENAIYVHERCRAERRARARERDQIAVLNPRHNRRRDYP